MEPKSVLFCTSGYFPDKSGGAEHQARLQAEELARRGHRVEVVCPRRRGTRVREVDGIRVYRVPVIERAYLLELSYCFLLGLFLLWRIRRFDVVHIHMTHLDSVVICVVASLFRRPVYAKIARGGPGGDARYLAKKWYLRRTALVYPARFQAISDEIASDLAGVGVAASRIVRIPNGVDLPSAGEDQAEARTRLGLPAGTVIVLFLGRFVAMKGLDVLLEAWATLPHRDAALVVVGRRAHDGSAVQVAGSGAGPVVVRDWTDEPAAYMDAADIFVLPSRGEGMSNALLRAMSHGLAVIATRVGAAEAMIEDGVSGLLIPVEDAPALRDALCRLTEEAAMRVSCGRLARARAHELFSIESVVDRIEAEYDAILNR